MRKAFRNPAVETAKKEDIELNMISIAPVIYFVRDESNYRTPKETTILATVAAV